MTHQPRRSAAVSGSSVPQSPGRFRLMPARHQAGFFCCGSVDLGYARPESPDQVFPRLSDFPFQDPVRACRSRQRLAGLPSINVRVGLFVASVYPTRVSVEIER